jgi:predicted nucleic acid-binding protein
MPVSMRLYLDCCSYNRLYDDPSQSRIANEADAVKQILAAVDAGTIELVGSDVLDLEFAQTKDEARRLRLQQLRKPARTVIMWEQESRRARELEGLGFHSMDALHLASAESAEVERFVTTDDRLNRRAARHKGR